MILPSLLESIPCSHHIWFRYFSYQAGAICGIPSVALQGDKADWLRPPARLDRLPELGDAPTQWAEMLRLILSRFVAAFDGTPEIKFWSHVVSRDSRLCGTDFLSGWITAFCMWDCEESGSEDEWNLSLPWMRIVRLEVSCPSPVSLSRCKRVCTNANDTSRTIERGTFGSDYSLDVASYPTVDMKKVPAGYASVDVLTIDRMVNVESKMVAGHVTAAASVSPAFPVSSSAVHSSLQLQPEVVRQGLYDTLNPAL